MECRYIDDAKLIMVAEGAIPFPTLAIQAADELGKWEASTIGRGADPEYRSSSTVFLTKALAAMPQGAAPLLAAAQTMLTRSLAAVVEAYSVENVVRVTENQGFMATRYAPGNLYQLHYDNDAYRLQTPDIWERRVSFVAYLNEDYEGGELHFPQYRLGYRPKAGSVVMFPASYTHRHASLKVTSGYKYIVTTWLT